MLKKWINTVGPLLAAAYTFAWAYEHWELFMTYSAHPYAVTTLVALFLIYIGWFVFGLVDVLE